MHLRLFAPALLIAVALSGCSAGTDTARPPAPSQPATAQTTAAPTAAPSAAPSPTRPAARLIEITYAAGEVRTAESRVEVRRGEQVVLRVTSDVTEEIHVHGYDLLFDVPAGSTVEKTFTADLPGQWEVELHGVGRPLLVLKVA